MVVMRLKFHKRSTMKFVSRIIQSRYIEIGNYPRGEAERDQCGSNSPPLGAQVRLDTAAACGGVVHLTILE